MQQEGFKPAASTVTSQLQGHKCTQLWSKLYILKMGSCYEVLVVYVQESD